MLGEVLVEQVTEGLTVVGEHAVAVIHITEQLRQVVFQGIATACLEFFKECGGPVGSVHFVTVIEEGVRVGHTALGESFLKTVEIMAHSFAVKMVDHISFTTGGSTFHLLTGAAGVDGDHSPGVSTGVEGFHALQTGVWTLFLRCRQVELTHIHTLGMKEGVDEHHLTGSLVDGYLWTTEGPSRAVVHIYLDTVSGCDILDITQGLHPSW